VQSDGDGADRRILLRTGTGASLLVLVLSVGGRQTCAGVVAAVLSLFIVLSRALYMSI
jgi:hypothetical protein